jgi:hypothetical protein
LLYSSPKIFKRASSSEIICRKFIRKIKIKLMSIPNHHPNHIVEEIISKRRPKHIGFLEYLYMPSVRRTAVSDGVKGLIVVL